MKAAPPAESREVARKGTSLRCLMGGAWEEAWGWPVGACGRRDSGGTFRHAWSDRAKQEEVEVASAP